MMLSDMATSVLIGMYDILDATDEPIPVDLVATLNERGIIVPEVEPTTGD